MATAIAGVLAYVLSSGVARAETLADAIAMAYRTNPTLLSARAGLRALDETYVQARAGFRPQVSASVEGDYSNSPTTLSVGVQDAQAGITASQPLYTGGLVSAQVRTTNANILAGREKLRQVEADVVQSVIEAYVDVRRDQQAMAIAEEDVAVLNRQLEETNARFDAGEVTRTDIAQSEARLAAAKAQLSSARAQLSVSLAKYAADVGQAPGELAPEPPMPDLPAAIDQAMNVGGNNSPVVRAADYAEQAAAAGVTAARSAYHPTVSLRAQFGYVGYYANDPFLGVHNGLYDRNITASIVLTQPIFFGGANASRVRQAVQEDSAQLIDIDVAQRQVVQQIGGDWAQLQAARANVAAEAEQVRADQVAYEGSHAEQQVGQRTVLDVLNAEQELRNAQLALLEAKHDEYVAGAKLLNATGLLSARTFAPDLAGYDPDTSFKRVKREGAVPWEGLIARVDSIGAAGIQHPPRLVAIAPTGQTPVVQRNPTLPVEASTSQTAGSQSQPNLLADTIGQAPVFQPHLTPWAGAPAARPPRIQRSPIPLAAALPHQVPVNLRRPTLAARAQTGRVPAIQRHPILLAAALIDPTPAIQKRPKLVLRAPTGHAPIYNSDGLRLLQ